MAAASFSIYAFEALQKEPEQVDELRFIFTSPTFNKEREKKQKRETQNGRKMSHYSDLLGKAVASIVEQKEQSDIDSLFSFGETTALVGDIRGLDDFELICFLIIKANG